MDVVALGAAVSVMAAVLAFGLAVGTVPVGARLRSRLDSILSGEMSVGPGGALDPLRERAQGGFFKALLSAARLSEMQRDLLLADSKMHPSDFLAIRSALALLGLAAALLLLGGVFGVLLGAALALAGFVVPQMWIGHRKAARAKKLEEQLPEALTMIANALKAGFGLLQALNLTAERMEHPMGTELTQTVYETNVGSSMDEAFQALTDRNQSYDLDIVVTAVLIQRSAGGNLAGILDTVAATMRERVRIRGEINTLTAQQKLTGIVIGLLPVGVAGMFLLVSPSYISVLFTANVGRVLLAIGGFMELIGILVIRRILSIEV